MGDKSVELNNCSLISFNFLLGWLTRRDLTDMWFKLVLIKRSKLFLIGFAIISLSLKHVTNNSLSEPVFHSEVEAEISLLPTLFTKLEMLFLLSLSESCIS